jgi:hypothetical protein
VGLVILLSRAGGCITRAKFDAISYVNNFYSHNIGESGEHGVCFKL